MTIGRRIYDERIRLAHTEAKFGELCGHKTDAIVRWEKGSDHPDAPALAKWAEEGIDVYFMLTGHTGPRSREESDLIAAYRECRTDTQKSILESAKAGKSDAESNGFSLNDFNKRP